MGRAHFTAVAAAAAFGLATAIIAAQAPAQPAGQTGAAPAAQAPARTPARCRPIPACRRVRAAAGRRFRRRARRSKARTA